MDQARRHIAAVGCCCCRVTEKGNYTEMDAAHIIRQILQGVQYLHSHGELRNNAAVAVLRPEARVWSPNPSTLPPPKKPHRISLWRQLGCVE